MNDLVIDQETGESKMIAESINAGLRKSRKVRREQ